MHNLSSLTIAAILATTGVVAHNSTIQCAKGLKMFVSRGTGENETYFGATEALVKEIAERIDGSDYEAIKYPASNGDQTNEGDPSYFVSVGNGTRLVKDAVEEYAAECPGSKMAFFGYSQGGQITSNSFCGMPAIWAYYAGFAAEQLDEILEYTEPLPKEITKNVVSIVLFGDPTHRNDASYNYGNSTGNAMFWRSDISACEELGSRIRSYCDASDPFCDVGKEASVKVHGKYLERYSEEVTQYVVAQYKSSGQSSSQGSV